MEYKYKEMRAFAVDFAYYIHIKKLGDLSHEKHKELFDEWVKEKLPQAFVSGRSELLRAYFKWHKEQGFVSHKDSDIDEFFASNCH